MSDPTDHAFLWDGTAPLGTAHVLTASTSVLVLRATSNTSKSGVLKLRAASEGRVGGTLHEFWKQLHHADGAELRDLEHRDAWRMRELAMQHEVEVRWERTSCGAITFFDARGRVVDVAEAEQEALLERMLRAGCEITEVMAD